MTVRPMVDAARFPLAWVLLERLWARPCPTVYHGMVMRMEGARARLGLPSIGE